MFQQWWLWCEWQAAFSMTFKQRNGKRTTWTIFSWQRLRHHHQHHHCCCKKMGRLRWWTFLCARHEYSCSSLAKRRIKWWWICGKIGLYSRNYFSSCICNSVHYFRSDTRLIYLTTRWDPNRYYHWYRVKLGVMAMKGYFTLPELQNWRLDIIHHWVSYQILALFFGQGSYPFSRGYSQRILSAVVSLKNMFSNYIQFKNVSS